MFLCCTAFFSAAAGITYADDDGHCPVLSEIVFDGAASFPMYPMALVYTSPVTYGTEEGIEPLATGDWDVALLRFSDNQTDVVELEVQNTGLHEGAAPSALLSVSPCPAPGPVSVSVSIPAGSEGRVVVYDARGGLVRALGSAVPGGTAGPRVWAGRDSDGSMSSSGIYFVRLEAQGLSGTGRLVLLR